MSQAAEPFAEMARAQSGSRLAVMLGDLIARLDQPGVAAALLSSLDADLAKEIERRAATVSMTSSEFTAGAVREFVERADDNLWFQLLTVIRRAEDPSLEAIRTILQWVLESDNR